METDPREHAVSRVPGYVSFAVEFRSQDAKTLENFSRILETECEKIGGERGVTFELGDAVSSQPARMSQPLVALAEAQAKAAGHLERQQRHRPVGGCDHNDGKVALGATGLMPGPDPVESLIGGEPRPGFQLAPDRFGGLKAGMDRDAECRAAGQGRSGG